MSLNNRQLSFIITFFTMAIIMLTLFNIQLAGQKDEEYLYELSYDEKTLEELLKEEIKPDLAELETHQAYNEAQKSRYDQELQEFKSLDELVEEQSSQNQDDNASDDMDPNAVESGFSKKFAEKLKEQRQKLTENQKINAPNENVNIKRRTTISYSLLDRSHLDLPNPVYTCESFGKVVINVTVNASGNVMEATYNKASSTTENGCLIDNAITYALQARFTKSPGKTSQLGTITYLFQGE